MRSKKVVLISKSGYVAVRDEALLKELVTAKIQLFCAVGVDADQWEEALDNCLYEYGEANQFIVTTSHVGESEEEVIAFASDFHLESIQEVEVISA